MTLEEWVLERIASAANVGTTATADSVCRALAESSGVSFVTVSGAYRGARMGLYTKARAVSKATGWQVSIPELCGDSEITYEIRGMFA